jgi:hypothetical protein
LTCAYCLATTDLVAGQTIATSMSHLRAFTSTFRSALEPGTVAVGAGGLRRPSPPATPGRLRSRVVAGGQYSSIAILQYFLRRRRAACEGGGATGTITVHAPASPVQYRTPDWLRGRWRSTCGSAHVCAHTWSFTTHVQRTPCALCAEGRHRVCPRAATHTGWQPRHPRLLLLTPLAASLSEAGESP